MAKRKFQDADEVIGVPTKPPLINDYIANVLRSSREPIPDCMPRDPGEGAAWWIAMQEQPKDSYAEVPEKVYDHNGDLKGWRLPYHERLAHNLRIFLTLSSAHQIYIAEAWQQHGVAWRGDMFPMFSTIVEEHKLMKAEPEAYRDKALKMLASGATIAQ